jgi:probable phosphoglycerate mutase
MNAPTTVFLIRHGSNPKVGKGLTGWLSGVSLDDNGRRQAEAVALNLADRGISAIYSSPLERALETAEPLARRLGIEVIREPGFGEVRYGEWQGKDFPEIGRDPIWKRFNEFRSGTRAPGGELMLETQARFVSALIAAGSRHGGESVAVFSHADAIKSGVCWILGMPLDFHNRLEILPGSITKVVMDAETFPSVRSVNVCPDNSL